MEVFIMSATSLYRLFAPQIEFLSPAEKQVFFYIDNHISIIEKMSLTSLAGPPMSVLQLLLECVIN